MSGVIKISAPIARKLRAEWHGPLSVAALAAAFKLATSTIRAFWADERSGGRLPAHPEPRPHFAKRSAPVEEIATAEDDDIKPRDLQDRGDLLARLRKYHGTDRLRGVNDEIPLQTLEIERLDKTGIYTPSRSRVRDFQRGRDAYVAAHLSKKDK